MTERYTGGQTAANQEGADVYHIPATEERVDDFQPEHKRRFSRRLVLGVSATAAAAIVGGVLFGMNSNTSAEAPKARPTASAPAVPGEHTATSTPSSIETQQTTPTDQTFTFIEKGGKKVVGLANYIKDQEVLVDKNALDSQVQTQDERYTYAKNVVDQMISNAITNGQNAMDPSYGPVGPATSESSSFYLKAFQASANSPLIDNGVDSDLVQQFYNQFSETRLHGQTITSYKVESNVAMIGTDERQPDHTAITSGVKVDLTMNDGTNETLYGQFIFSDETNDQGQKVWNISGYTSDTAASAAQNQLIYGDIASASSN